MITLQWVVLKTCVFLKVISRGGRSDEDSGPVCRVGTGSVRSGLIAQVHNRHRIEVSRLFMINATIPFGHLSKLCQVSLKAATSYPSLVGQLQVRQVMQLSQFPPCKIQPHPDVACNPANFSLIAHSTVQSASTSAS